MYYAPMSFPVLVFLIVAFICYMRKTSPKKCSHRYVREPPPESIPSIIEHVINRHRNCPSVTFDIIAWDYERARVSIKHIPGDRVELGFIDGDPAVFIDGVFIDRVRVDSISALSYAIENGRKYEAYILERDMAASSSDLDFLTIVVYYINHR